MARILVVDDEADIRVAFRRILEGEGHVVEEAANGKLAITVCRVRCPDVIVTDLFMPEMDGFEVLWELKRSCPGLRAICVSGGGDHARMEPVEGLLRTAQRFGAFEVLTKPVKAADLVAAVAAALARPPAREKTTK